MAWLEMFKRNEGMRDDSEEDSEEE
jgi:hypothetical protein